MATGDINVADHLTPDTPTIPAKVAKRVRRGTIYTVIQITVVSTQTIPALQ
jgi:hypothetical protein